MIKPLQLDKNISLSILGGIWMNFGDTFKKIRVNKNLSQKQITDKIMTQGAYSNFESFNTDIKVSTFYQLLEKLSISPEEFNYLLHHHNYSPANTLVQRFLRIPYNQPKEINNLIKDIKSYPNLETNTLLQDIYYICEAYLQFNKENNKKQLQDTLHTVWLSIGNKDELYLMDIYILNSILFLFPIETAIHLKQFLFRSIDKYNNFQHIEKMKLTISLNISLMYLEEEMYLEAIDELEQCILYSKKFSDYTKLPFCYNRKGLCLNQLNKNGQPWLDKALHLLNAIEREDLIPLLEEERQLLIKKSHL